MNRATLIGRLGRDPDARTTPGGARVVSFSVATSERWRDKSSGEMKERTEWHNIVIWNENIGKIAEQYCRKGSQILIEGAIQSREYTDKDGAQRKVTEIVLQGFNGTLKLLDGKRDDDGGHRSSEPASRSAPLRDQLDDEIPF